MLKDIESDVKYLKNNNTTQDILGKVQAVERLSTNSYWLASMVADAYEAKNNTEFMYKSSVSSSVVMNTGPVGKAAEEAKNTYKDLYESHLKADSNYRRLSLLLGQTNVIIEQARQTISYLKQEMRHGM